MAGSAAQNRAALALLFLIVTALAAEPALAHEETSVAGGFVTGFTHPIIGLDHLLAMVAVGLWGAFLKRPLIYVLPVLFPAVMAVGGVLGMAEVPVPPVEIVIALSVLVLGALIAFARALPVLPACLIVATFAIFHGYAHGAELPLAADPLLYSAGFVVATGLLHIAGIALGMLTGAAGRLQALPRAAGGVIALFGVYFLVQATLP
jgi:urease accessory protein